MTKVDLLTLRGPSVFTSKMEMHFMRKGTKLCTSFTSPRLLNTKFPSCGGDEPKDLPLMLILVKIKSLGYLSPHNLWNTEGLGVLSFPILLKTEGRYCGVDGCNLSNTDDFGLDVALSPLSFPASSAIMCYVSDRLFLRRLETFTGWDGM